MDEHQHFSQDDNDDTLLFEKLQERALEQYPNPDRIGCLDHSTLEAWVNTPEKLDLADPKYLHVLKCVECTRELIEFRRRRNEQAERILVAEIPNRATRAWDWRWAAFASVLLCCLAVAGMFYWHTRLAEETSPAALANPVAETIDLSQAGTTRGSDTATVPAVVLPRRRVTAHLILPNFSPGGNYAISITTDRSGASSKAAGRAIANVQGFHADLTVTLDLRGLSPGTYFLATTHDGDPASYFYPLAVR